MMGQGFRWHISLVAFMLPVLLLSNDLAVADASRSALMVSGRGGSMIEFSITRPLVIMPDKWKASSARGSVGYYIRSLDGSTNVGSVDVAGWGSEESGGRLLFDAAPDTNGNLQLPRGRYSLHLLGDARLTLRIPATREIRLAATRRHPVFLETRTWAESTNAAYESQERNVFGAGDTVALAIRGTLAAEPDARGFFDTCLRTAPGICDVDGGNRNFRRQQASGPGEESTAVQTLTVAYPPQSRRPGDQSAVAYYIGNERAEVLQMLVLVIGP
jgi:hypothetical protein